MKKQLRFAFLTAAALVVGHSASAQTRYLEEVFSDADIEKVSNVVYGTNVDFLKNTQLLDPAYIDANQAALGAERAQLLDSIANGNPIPMAFFMPYALDTTTKMKVSNMQYDVYMPKLTVDSLSERPVIFYVHTGNFLPPVINGGPGGSKADSAGVELCKQWAKRGYVAVAVNYRHGWNPQASGQTGEIIRRATLLNAVYRAIHDVKQSVRHLRANASTYGVNKDKVVLFGQGSGGYVVLAYNTLDKISETATDKFLNPLSLQSYINPQAVGGVDGFGGLLNLYTDNGESAAISATVNIGGALGDIAWLEGNEVPMISLHCVHDPFAPFDTADVIVPTTQENVVPVPGPNMFIPMANSLGVNDKIKDYPGFNDPYTTRARSLYGKTYDHFLPAPFNQITIDQNAEGLFAFEFPLNASSRFQNQGSPWEWWSLSDLQTLVAGTNAATGGSYDANTIHTGGLVSNPDMSKSKALTYIDTIQGYMHPRIMLAAEIGDWQSLNASTPNKVKHQVSVFPNPANDVINASVRGNAIIKSYSVVDLTGKQVVSENQTNSNYIMINTSNFNTGIYFLEINTTEGREIHKVVVQ